MEKYKVILTRENKGKDANEWMQKGKVWVMKKVVEPTEKKQLSIWANDEKDLKNKIKELEPSYEIDSFEVQENFSQKIIDQEKKKWEAKKAKAEKEKKELPISILYCDKCKEVKGIGEGGSHMLDGEKHELKVIKDIKEPNFAGNPIKMKDGTNVKSDTDYLKHLKKYLP